MCGWCPNIFVMKKIVLIIAMFVAYQADAQIAKAKLQASGLTCAMCSKAVYKALSEVDFVAKVSPDIEGSTYAIEFKDGKEPQLDELSKAVEDAGFSVARLDIVANFKGIKPEKGAHVTLGSQLFHFISSPAQALEGEKTIRVVDRNFVTEKDARNFEKLADAACYASGTMDGKRVYHVTL